MKRKICVVSGSRADYGLLYWVMKELEIQSAIELQIVVTGMHLAPEFGETWRVIEEDGFKISSRVEMLVAGTSSVATAKSIGLGVIGFADALSSLGPDILLVLGDRFEIFAAVQAALILRIPVAHIAGGDVTEGAFDEAIRHSITKMAQIHFVTNEKAAANVRQLGENPEFIFVVGSPGLDYVRRVTVLNRDELEEQLGVSLRAKNLLITFHPVTLDAIPSEQQLDELLLALEQLGPEFGLFFTMPNADPKGAALRKQIEAFVSAHENARSYVSLGQERYLSLVAHVDAVVGNSSSGLYEAPSFRKPTVNIGDRQKGRLLAKSVVSCEPERRAIHEAIRRALALDCSAVVNPYGDGRGSERIAKILAEMDDPSVLIKKQFFTIERFS